MMVYTIADRGGSMISTYWNSTGISERFIDALRKYCENNEQVEKVVLFGSRARGDHQKSSDIDLIVFTKGSSHSDQNLMENYIYELPTPLKIDVVFADRLSKEKMLSNIINEGIIIYEQRKDLREVQ